MVGHAGLLRIALLLVMVLEALAAGSTIRLRLRLSCTHVADGHPIAGL